MVSWFDVIYGLTLKEKNQNFKIQKLQCPQCTFYTEDPRAMKMHRNGAHGAKQNTPKNGSSTQKSSDNMKKLTTPKIDIHGVKFSASKSDANSVKSSAPKKDAHRVPKHDTKKKSKHSTPINTQSRLIKCKQCKKDFSHINVLKIHQEMAHKKQATENNMILNLNPDNLAQVKSEPNIENDDPLIDPLKIDRGKYFSLKI